MKEANPYEAPVGPSPPGIDPKMLERIATYLARFRERPPTVLSGCFRSRSFWFLVVGGVAVFALLTWLMTLTDGRNSFAVDTRNVWAGYLLGSLIREIKSWQTAKKVWPAQSYFINWEKVDENL